MYSERKDDKGSGRLETRPVAACRVSAGQIRMDLTKKLFDGFRDSGEHETNMNSS